MSVKGIIQARLGSTRLPGKVLSDICGRPMLEWMLLRVSKAKKLEQIIVATTDDPSDDLLSEWVTKNTPFQCFRGNEKDLVTRYYECALHYSTDVIVRLTADDPLKDPTIIDQAITLFVNNKQADYCSNCLVASYPEGLDVEVFSMGALKRTYSEAKLESEREHLTPYITNNPQLFSLINFEYEEKLSDWRWTVDKPVDLDFMRRIFSEFKEDPCVDFREVIAFLRANPELMEINKGTARFEGYLKSVAKEKQ